MDDGIYPMPPKKRTPMVMITPERMAELEAAERERDELRAAYVEVMQERNKADDYYTPLTEALEQAERALAASAARERQYHDALVAIAEFDHTSDCQARDYAPVYECGCGSETQWSIARAALSPQKETP